MKQTIKNASKHVVFNGQSHTYYMVAQGIESAILAGADKITLTERVRMGVAECAKDEAELDEITADIWALVRI